ncbi:MAG: hypothetical protein WBC05_10485 [Sedimentisphaerales bacterium]
MFHKSSKQILLGIFIALMLIPMPICAVENFKISSYGGGHQIWFEAEDYDERNPDTDQYYPVVDAADAFGQAITRTGDAGGMIRWTFNINSGGTWYFWARQINPGNTSDYMLVEGDPDDAEIPTGPTFPGGDGAPFDNADDRVFEIDVGPSWGWAQSWDIEGHTKELRDGENTMYIFHRQGNDTVFWDVFMWTDDAGYVPTDDDYQNAFPGLGFGPALRPDPADGASYSDTWATLSWRPGDFAVSHDVYLGDNFDDVNDGTGDTFRGNQTTTFIVAGFPGFPFPDGLVPGTTYYWRIDEVNDADPNSPWRGPVWSFSIPPKTSSAPDPAVGAEFIDLDVELSWTAGYDAKVHYVYFGENFDDVNNATMGIPHGTTSYTPGQLNLAKTYYWRVDEFDGVGTYKGNVWSFTTLGAVSGPNPADGAMDVKPTVVLSWDAGAVATSHEVYFGTDSDAVKNATKTSPEYKEPKALGEESYDPGKLMLNSTYFWRIDEVNGINPDSPWAGNVWSFTTGDFFVIDDFEIYDANDNQIWYSWHDGLGYGSLGTDPYFAGNGSAAEVGDGSTTSYTEESIVHSGAQSMPYWYNNYKQGYSYYSEAEKTLSDTRDWTEEGVMELSLWFRGNPASVGSFTEGPVGTYTMTASGTDIWNQADEFHYAFKMLTGPGSIVAQVLSVDNTDPWAKTGVMIRETLDAGSKFAAVYITPTNPDGSATNGCRFQARIDTDIDATSDTSVATAEQMALTAPYWVKLERDVAGNFRGYYSSNGSTWQAMAWNIQNISMSSNVYVGLALTSHNVALTGEAVFSNVTITGTVGAQWANQDVGIESNEAEPLYIAVSNSAGAPAVVVHDDPAAAQIDTWTEWIIPLQAFADQGINLNNVDRIAIGLGTQGNTTIPGGSGKMFFDDFRLYRLRTAP